MGVQAADQILRQRLVGVDGQRFLQVGHGHLHQSLWHGWAQRLLEQFRANQVGTLRERAGQQLVGEALVGLVEPLGDRLTAERDDVVQVAGGFGAKFDFRGLIQFFLARIGILIGNSTGETTRAARKRENRQGKNLR